MTKKISGIYKWINKVNQHYYVGSSVNMIGNCRSRKNCHITKLNNDKHENRHLKRAWDKYGEENFEFVIIEQDIPEKELLIVEQKYLDIAKTEKDKCYNISFIAGKVEWTPETRAKMGRATKARFSKKENHPMYGKKVSKETREKMSKAKIGTKRTGKILKGSEHYWYNHTIYIFKNIKTEEIFTGTNYEFYTKFNFHKTTLRQVLMGKCKTMGKKTWILVGVKE